MGIPALETRIQPMHAMWIKVFAPRIVGSKIWKPHILPERLYLSQGLYSIGEITMIRTLLIILISASAIAQSWIPLPAGSTAPSVVTLTVKPISLVSTRRVLGQGRAVGLWSVSPCNDTLSSRLIVPRPRLMAAVPDLVDLPNDLAEDIVGRQTTAAPASFIGTNGDKILGLISTGLMIAGFATGTKQATYVGAGTAGLQFVFQSIGSRAPTAQPYFSRLLPTLIPLEPGQCGEYFLFASLMHNAQPRVVRIGQ